MPGTARLFVLALVTLLSARGLLAEAPPPAAPAPVGPTRLFFAPTARSLPHGKGTIGLTEIAAPWGEVGLTGRVSVLAGSVVPLGIVGIAPRSSSTAGAASRRRSARSSCSGRTTRAGLDTAS